MPVSSRGPRRRRSWWCHTCSSTPSARTPAKRAGSSDAACRHGLMWDHTVFHVVASCRARPAIVAPSKRSCRIAQRIARAPRRARGAHTELFCSMKVAIWQVCSRHIHRRLCHRILVGTPAQGASMTSTTMRPWPCAITPQPGQPASWLHDSTSSSRASGVRVTLIALQTDEQITPIATVKRRTAAGRVRHRSRAFEDRGGVEVRSSPGTSTSTRNPRPTPGHPHSTRKSRIKQCGSPQSSAQETRTVAAASIRVA